MVVFICVNKRSFVKTDTVISVLISKLFGQGQHKTLYLKTNRNFLDGC